MHLEMIQLIPSELFEKNAAYLICVGFCQPIWLLVIALAWKKVRIKYYLQSD